MFADIPKKAAGASPRKGFFIAEIAEGAAVTGQVAVARKELRQTKAGNPFLSLTLSDRTGRIEAKDFDNAVENDSVFAPGAVAKVRAKVSEYNGERQLVIERARACKAGEYDVSDFVPATPYDVDALLASLQAMVEQVRNEWIRALLLLLLERNAVAFKAAPAAMRLHHAYTGGLLEHVLSMCRAACSLCGHYTRLDRDVLIAGCVLHDLGKITELRTSAAIEYSTAGRLVGHIADGLILLEDACREIDGFPGDLKLLLRHIIVSHHGEYDFGALKLPMTPEAIALHYIDELDAKLHHVFGMIDAAGDAEFTAKDWSLDREIYCVRP